MPAFCCRRSANCSVGAISDPLLSSGGNMRRSWFVKAIPTLLALVVASSSASAQGFMVTGYADIEAVLNKGDGTSEFYFDNHHFNLIVLGKLFKNTFASAEIEYEHAGEEIALEYGYITYMGIKNLRISGGKFIIPFGRFNKDLHPTWINKMPGRPLGFANVFPQTYSDVGLWVTGGALVGGGGARVVYDAFVINGLLGDDGGGIRGMRGNDREKLSAGGRDNNKALGGRLGLELPAQGFDIGASIYSGNYLDNPDSTLTLTMFDVDAAFRYRGLVIRAEIVIADQAATGGDLKKTGGYGQLSYLTTIKLEPVFRFSMRDMPDPTDNRKQYSFGLGYYLAPHTAVRVAYHLNKEDSGFEAKNDQFIAQWSMTF